MRSSVPWSLGDIGIGVVRTSGPYSALAGGSVQNASSVSESGSDEAPSGLERRDRGLAFRRAGW